MHGTMALDWIGSERRAARLLEAEAERMRPRPDGARLARLGFRRGAGEQR